MLADLYFQADSYVPALETIERLLALPEARDAFARPDGPSSRARRFRAGSPRVTAWARSRTAASCSATKPTIDRLPVRARLHLQCAEALFRLGRLEESRESAERALGLADRGGDLGAGGSGAQSARPRLPIARRSASGRATSTNRRWRSTGESVTRSTRAYVRNNLGLIHKNLCEWEAAVTHLRGALELHERNGRFAETANPLTQPRQSSTRSAETGRVPPNTTRRRSRSIPQVGDQLRPGGGVDRPRQHRAPGATLRRRRKPCWPARWSWRARTGHGARRFWRSSSWASWTSIAGRPEVALERYAEALALAERVAPEGDLVVEVERRRAEALCASARSTRPRRRAHAPFASRDRIDDRLEHAVAHRVAGTIAMARGAAARSESPVGAGGRPADRMPRASRARANVPGDGAPRRRPGARAPLLLPRRSGVRGPLQPVLAGAVRARAPSLSERDPGRARPSRPASLLGQAASRAGSGGVLSGDAARRGVWPVVPRHRALGAHHRRDRHRQGAGRADHPRRSPAAPRAPFLAVNCGALRADLALSQLFGHRKGAFTGAHAEGVGLVEAAHGGTLFLDEVGELPHDVQVTLLRFLESGEYLRLGETQVRRADVRLIAATNRELRGADEKLVPPRLALPAQRDRDPRPAAARAHRRHRSPGPPLPRVLWRDRRPAPGARGRGGPALLSAGPATCASSRT